MTAARSAPRVLIALDTSTAWSRGVLRGFVGVARELGWDLLHYHTPADLRWLVDVWKPAALVLQLSHYRAYEDVLRHCRVVCLNDDAGEAGIPFVCLDDEAIGRLAAKHLMDCGLRNLTTFRFDDQLFAQRRERGFHEAASADGARLAPG